MFHPFAQNAHETDFLASQLKIWRTEIQPDIPPLSNNSSFKVGRCKKSLEQDQKNLVSTPWDFSEPEAIKKQPKIQLGKKFISYL
jgi:hypothetical protein